MTLAVNRSHPRGWLFLCTSLCVLLASCGDSGSLHKLSGTAMGTSWHISYLDNPASPKQAEVEQGVAALLERLEDSMSTYRPDSEISRFNQLPALQWYAISNDMLVVLQAARELHQHSQGTFDITVGPLVDLWGFGPDPQRDKPPSEDDIAKLSQRVGQHYLQLDVAASKISKSENIALDLSSIAKGYGVDVVARWLLSQHIDNFLVEIGGELRVAGHSPRGDLWRVAIEQPDALKRSVAKALVVTNRGMATSGDYRNFFEVDGKRYSHTLDPRTGRPVNHDLVSVTVVADTAMQADGWATALTVLGAKRGYALAVELDLAVYFITRSTKGFQTRVTPAMLPFVVVDKS